MVKGLQKKSRRRFFPFKIFPFKISRPVKKNEIVPFAAALMDLETVILTEVIFRQRSRNTI